MKTKPPVPAIAMLLFAGILLPGCSTPNHNPPAPRANTGYVDFHTDSALALSWEVKRFEEPGSKPKTVFSDPQPVPGTVLRIPSPPGRQRFQVWFLNRATEGPQTVETNVENGKVTPVRVTLSSVREIAVERKSYGFTPSKRGYVQREQFSADKDVVYRIGAVPEALKPYQPKEQMPYWSSKAE
jgi:hypothetical protein